MLLQRRLRVLLIAGATGRGACRRRRPIRGLIPGLFLSATEPVLRRRLNHRLRVAGETPKAPTASFLGMPQSTAASILSAEVLRVSLNVCHACMAQDHLLCKTLKNLLVCVSNTLWK